MGPWRDTHLRIAGPVVQAIQLGFTEDWFWAAREVPELNWNPQAVEQHGLRVLSLPPGPAQVQDSGELFFLEALRNARSVIWISSLYFLPDEQIVSSLDIALRLDHHIHTRLPITPPH